MPLLIVRSVTIAIILSLAEILFPPNVRAYLDNPMTPKMMSGSYTLIGSIRDRSGRQLLLSGNLEIDWLGDLSGEGSVVEGTGHACHLLLDGSYTQSAPAPLITGAVSITPVYGNCGMALGRAQNWKVYLTSGAQPGQIDLFQRGASYSKLVMLATPESHTFSSSS